MTDEMPDVMPDEPLIRLDRRHVWNFWRIQEELNEDLAYERKLTCYWNRIDQVPHPDILPLLHEAGFGYVSMIIQGAKLNPSLISALVERWRPETHTFHLPYGEAIITLEDVAYQLGLPVEGHAITGKAEDNWFLLGRELLGVDPVDLDGGRVLITGLDEHFSDLPNNASMQLKEQFARAHILRVIGGILMPDKSRNKFHLMWLRHLWVLSDAGKFSWGSAVLAFLFRELCKATDPSKHVIGGCLLLLQSWAWFRMPFIRPTLHQPTSYIFPLILRWTGPLSSVGLPDCQRDFQLLIDKNDEFVWTPYAVPKILNCVPPQIFQGAQVWMSKVPLINYAVIEWHPVDRVLRQFNCVQPIPPQSQNLDSLHRLTRQGKTNVNWRSHHSTWIMQWADRYSRHPVCQPIETYSVTYDYFDWYVANGKPHILTPAERQRVLHARPQNRPPTRRAHPAAPGDDEETTQGRHPAHHLNHNLLYADLWDPHSNTITTPTVVCDGFQFPARRSYTTTSLLYTGGPTGIGAGSSQARRTATPDDDETDESTEEEELVPRRNPYRNRHPPGCGTGGHRHH
ncbi:hypothetical protein GQ457_06G012080 [Hibiscus cannabinus]